MSIYEIAFAFWGGVAALGAVFAIGGGVASAGWRALRLRTHESHRRWSHSPGSAVPVALLARNRMG